MRLLAWLVGLFDWLTLPICPACNRRTSVRGSELCAPCGYALQISLKGLLKGK